MTGGLLMPLIPDLMLLHIGGERERPVHRPESPLCHVAPLAEVAPDALLAPTRARAVRMVVVHAQPLFIAARRTLRPSRPIEAHDVLDGDSMGARHLAWGAPSPISRMEALLRHPLGVPEAPLLPEVGLFALEAYM